MRSSTDIINEEDEDLEREIGVSPGKAGLFVKESFVMPPTLKTMSRYNTFDDN